MPLLVIMINVFANHFAQMPLARRNNIQTLRQHRQGTSNTVAPGCQLQPCGAGSGASDTPPYRAFALINNNMTGRKTGRHWTLTSISVSPVEIHRRPWGLGTPGMDAQDHGSEHCESPVLSLQPIVACATRSLSFDKLREYLTCTRLTENGEMFVSLRNAAVMYGQELYRSLVNDPPDAIVVATPVLSDVIR